MTACATGTPLVQVGLWDKDVPGSPTTQIENVFQANCFNVDRYKNTVGMVALLFLNFSSPY